LAANICAYAKSRIPTRFASSLKLLFRPVFESKDGAEAMFTGYFETRT